MEFRDSAGFNLEIWIHGVSFLGSSYNLAAIGVHRIICKGPFHFGDNGVFSV